MEMPPQSPFPEAPNPHPQAAPNIGHVLLSRILDSPLIRADRQVIGAIADAPHAVSAGRHERKANSADAALDFFKREGRTAEDNLADHLAVQATVERDKQERFDNKERLDRVQPKEPDSKDGDGNTVVGKYTGERYQWVTTLDLQERRRLSMNTDGVPREQPMAGVGIHAPKGEARRIGRLRREAYELRNNELATLQDNVSPDIAEPGFQDRLTAMRQGGLIGFFEYRKTRAKAKQAAGYVKTLKHLKHEIPHLAAQITESTGDRMEEAYERQITEAEQRVQAAEAKRDEHAAKAVAKRAKLTERQNRRSRTVPPAATNQP